MLVIHVHPAIPSPWLLDAVADCTAAGIRVQSIARPATAMARVAGGGVGAILLDGSGGRSPQFDEALALLRRDAARIPLLVAMPSGGGHEGPELVVTPESASALPATLTGAMRGVGPAAAPGRKGRGVDGPGLIAMLGVKGGVGTSTLALNTAAALAELRDVALVEMRPDFGVLSGRVRGPARRSGLESLLTHAPARLDRNAVEPVLWQPERIERLRILSAPILQPHALTAAHAEAILSALLSGARTVLADLSLDIREAARATAVLADQVVLVCERTPACVAAVRTVRGELLAWGVSRDALNLAVVNRASIGVPPPLDRLEEELEMPLLDVLPPDADGCCLCESLRQTMVGLQPEGLMSDKYRSIARSLASHLPRPRTLAVARELAHQ